MNRKIKILSVILASVFAISVAATASAAEFHSSSAPVNITGTQTTGLVFKTNAGTVTCSIATFTGSRAGTTTASQALTPHFTTCKAFGFINTPIHIKKCIMQFFANGTTEVQCPPGSKMEITVPGCPTLVGTQHLASGMTYTTVGSSPNRDIIAHWNISGIRYTECGVERTNGTLTGSETWQAASGELWHTPGV